MSSCVLYLAVNIISRGPKIRDTLFGSSRGRCAWHDISDILFPLAVGHVIRDIYLDQLGTHTHDTEHRVVMGFVSCQAWDIFLAEGSKYAVIKSC